MSQQTEFALRNDGFWYAPPMDPGDEDQFTVSYTDLLAGVAIEEVISAEATYTTLDPDRVTFDDDSVSLWLESGTVNKIAVITIKVLAVNGRKLERSFKIEIKQL